MPCLNLSDFSTLFGTAEEDIHSFCGTIINSYNFEYRYLSKSERDQLLLSIIMKIDSQDLSRAGKARISDWDAGWQENLEDFIKSKHDLKTLVPKYFRKYSPLRFNSDYIQPISPNFEYNVLHIYRTWLFKKYFYNINTLYEFGCGTAHHLSYLATLYPEMKLVGLDWSKSSQDIIRMIRDIYSFNITGLQFDFFNPRPDIIFDDNSAILTFGALEQVGSNYTKFLDYLLAQKPTLCVNVECLHELYDASDLLDCLAFKYHQKRNYLSGYLTKLRELESEKKIEIIKCHHQKLSNVFNDTSSHVIWRTKQSE